MLKLLSKLLHVSEVAGHESEDLKKNPYAGYENLDVLAVAKGLGRKRASSMVCVLPNPPH